MGNTTFIHGYEIVSSGLPFAIDLYSVTFIRSKFIVWTVAASVLTMGIEADTISEKMGWSQFSWEFLVEEWVR